MKTRAIVISLGSALAFAALPAAAQEKDPQPKGFYAGLSVGQSTASSACDGAAALGVTCDDSSNTLKVFGGYQFNRHIAAEIGYTDNLVKATASGPGGSAEVKASAFELLAVPSYPFTDQFSVYGKVGMYSSHATAKSSTGLNASENDSGLTYGVGASYQLTRSFGLRLDWQRYDDVSGSDVDTVNLGVLYRF